MPTIDVNFTKVEEACEHLFDAHDQIGDLVELNAVERLLVLARMAYIHEQALKRNMCEHDLAAFERLRAKLIERAEALRAENLAADASGVNSEGGSA
jgi:hypothetical protein